MIVAFAIILLVSLVFAFVKGGAVGRLVCCLLIAAAVASALLAPTRHDAAHFLPGMFCVDAALLGALVAIVMWSRKKWAVVIAALQLNAVACHLAVFVARSIDPTLYYGMLTIWSVPIMLVFIAGVYFESLHRRPRPQDPRP